VFWGWYCKHGYQRGFQKLSHIEVYTLDENLEKVNRQKFEIPENLYNIEESSCNNSDLLCFLTYKTLTKPVVQNNQGEKLQRAIQEKTLFSSVDKEDLETSLLIYDFAYAEYLEFDLGLKGKNISDLKITETKDEKIIVSGLYLGKNEKELCIFNSVFDKNLELKDGSENFVNPEYLSQNQNFRIHNILNKPSGGFSIIIEEAYDRVPCGNLVIINYNSAAELTGQSFISKRQRTIGPTNWNPRISSFLNNDKVEIYYHLNEVESDTVYYIRSTIDSDNEVTHNILFKYDIKSPTLVKFNSLRQHNNSDIYLVAKYNDIEMMGKIQYKN
jgi:hypothetical protein